MSKTEAVVKRSDEADKIERVLMMGDIGRLSAEERISYYRMVCESVGLNPLTRPFDYITLNGKVVLYAKKDATDQLRSINQISVTIQAREVVEDCYVVTARATTPSGRTDESIGAVSIASLKGEARCNAMMKAETKAKRRVTLSISGLGLLDETELETIPNAKPVRDIDRTTEPIPIAPNSLRVEPVVEKTLYHESEDILILKNGPTESRSAAESAPETKPEFATPHPSVIAAAKQPGGLLHPEHPQNAVAYIDQGRKVAFARTFKDALPKALQKDADLLRTDWLVRHKYVDVDGIGTSGMIPMADFERVKNEAAAFAKGLGSAKPVDVREPFEATDDDIPF